MQKQTPGVLTAFAILLLSGCVSYKPDPIDVEAAARAFEEATPEQAVRGAGKEFDLSNGVSVSEARLIALAQNPDLLAQRKQIGIAEAQLISAGIIPNPSFGLVWKNNTAPNAGPNYEVEILQSVRGLLNRSARQRVAQSVLDAARAQLAYREWVLVKEVEAAYFQALYWHTAVQLASQAVGLFEEVQEVARKRLQAGDATRLEVNLARIERDNARRDKAVAQADLAVAKQRLSSLLGLSPTYEFTMEPRQPDQGDKAAKQAALQSYSLGHRMDLAGMLEEYEAAEKALHLAIRRQYPDLQIGPAYERDSDGADLTGFGIELELPIFNRNQGEIAERMAERAKLKSEVAARILRIKTEVAAAYTRYKANLKLLKLFTEEVLPSLDENLKLLQKSFEAGEIDILLVITSQEKFLRARSTHAEAVRDLSTSRIELEKAIGGNLNDAVKGASSNTQGEKK